MSLNLALSLLRQGRNGEQILQILESIVSEGNAHERQFQTASEPIQL